MPKAIQIPSESIPQKWKISITGNPLQDIFAADAEERQKVNEVIEPPPRHIARHLRDQDRTAKRINARLTRE